MNKVTIITSKKMLKKLRGSMSEIGISRIKATTVKGCTLTSDIEPQEEPEFLQKVRLEMLVTDEQLSSLVDAMHSVFTIEG